MFRNDSVPQDWTAISRWLQGQNLGLDAAPPPRQFAGGLANLNYLVSVNGAPAVFRRPPGGDLAHGASDMAREARVLRALNPVFPLAPRSLAFCDDVAVIGVPFQLIEYRPGVAIGGGMGAAGSGLAGTKRDDKSGGDGGATHVDRTDADGDGGSGSDGGGAD